MFDIPGLQNLEAPLEAITSVAQNAWSAGIDTIGGAMSRGLIEPNVLDFSSDIYKNTVEGLLNKGQMPDENQCRNFLQMCMQFGGTLGFALGQRFLAYLEQEFERQKQGYDPGGEGWFGDNDGGTGGDSGGSGGYDGGESGGGGGSGGGGWGGDGGSGRSGGGGWGGDGGSGVGRRAGHGRGHAPTAWQGSLGGGIGESIMRSADKQVGDELWAQTEFAGLCEGGNVGCAASVTKVLRDVGVDSANSASVVELKNQLSGSGWENAGGAESAQPGDVIYGDGGGEHQHIGIVGVDQNGQLIVYNNHSSDGQWHADPINQCSILTDFDADQIHVLRAPGANSAKPTPSARTASPAKSA